LTDTKEVVMSVHTDVRPVAAPEDVSTLTGLMVEPELAVSDAPLYSPQAAMVLLALLLLSPDTPVEPKKKR
jgi:hypothetical protein